MSIHRIETVFFVVWVDMWFILFIPILHKDFFLNICNKTFVDLWLPFWCCCIYAHLLHALSLCWLLMLDKGKNCSWNLEGKRRRKKRDQQIISLSYTLQGVDSSSAVLSLNEEYHFIRLKFYIFSLHVQKISLVLKILLFLAVFCDQWFFTPSSGETMVQGCILFRFADKWQQNLRFVEIFQKRPF